MNAYQGCYGVVGGDRLPESGHQPQAASLGLLGALLGEEHSDRVPLGCNGGRVQGVPRRQLDRDHVYLPPVTAIRRTRRAVQVHSRAIRVHPD